MVRSSIVGLFMLCASGVVWPAAAHAQALGTFRWQMQPYCNVLSVTVTQNGGVYTLDGFDDQCGAATVAPLTGTAVPNPDGTIELGLNIVTSPGATPLHVAVPLNPATLGGPWQDSAGHTGSFVFTPGAGTGGSARPFGSGAVGALDVNPEEVQLRVRGTCPAGQMMQRVNQDGSVACTAPPASAGDITEVRTAPGGGLQGGAEAGAANLRLATTSSGAFDFSNPNGFAAVGTAGSGGLAMSGPGTRLVWFPGKAAFRAGKVNTTQWDNPSIGANSVAFNENTIASGTSSAAFGLATTAIGHFAAAFGQGATASGNASIAAGYGSAASGDYAVAMGRSVIAGGESSVALGSFAVALPQAHGSFVFADLSSMNKFTSFARNEFIARAAGGVGFYTNSTTTTGVELRAGSSAWLSLSDVNMKENFRDLDSQDVLARIARMPIREWNYKAQDAAIRHVGPTAQDFHAAFGLGEDPLRISTIDADGIALRAIQALEARTQSLADENRALADENRRLQAHTEALADESRLLRERLDAVERLIRKN